MPGPPDSDLIVRRWIKKAEEAVAIAREVAKSLRGHLRDV